MPKFKLHKDITPMLDLMVKIFNRILKEFWWFFNFKSGHPISVSYIADENGFQVQSDALPTPPPQPKVRTSYFYHKLNNLTYIHVSLILLGNRWSLGKNSCTTSTTATATTTSATTPTAISKRTATAISQRR